ncbi:hypothetical protein J1605_012775, partial [Eschrichtius robustus]
LCFGE